MSDYRDETRRLGGVGPSVCALVQDMLPFYLDNDLTKESRAFIEDHLHTCERCASFLAGGRSVQEHLRRDASVRPSRAAAYQMRTDDIIIRGRRRLIGYALLGAGMIVLLVMGFSTASRSVSAPAGVQVAVPEPMDDTGSGFVTVPAPMNDITEAQMNPMGGIATPTPAPMAPQGQAGIPPTPVPADIAPTPVPPTNP